MTSGLCTRRDPKSYNVREKAVNKGLFKARRGTRVKVVTLQAYLDRQSAQPGEVLRIHASNAVGCTVTVHQLVHSDPHPIGPGIVDRPCSWGSSTFSAKAKPPSQGSFGEVPAVFSVLPRTVIGAWHQPTDLSSRSTIFGWTAANHQWTLGLRDRRLCLSDSESSYELSAIHHERIWYFLGLMIDEAIAGDDSACSITLFSGQWGRTGGPLSATFLGRSVRPDPASSLWIGTSPALAQSSRGDLDGLVSGLFVHDVPLDAVDLMTRMNKPVPAISPWAFDDTTDPDRVPSSDAAMPALHLTHAPMRSLQGPPPVGRAGEEFGLAGSVQFHRDDTEDCGWPVAASVDIPDSAESGFYCIRLDSPGSSCELPFVVSGRAPVTLLAPTLTWQAYANLGRDRQQWPGRSLYSKHSDGSSVVINTSLRPSQTFAPAARLEVDQGDGHVLDQVVSHLLMADLYAEYWLTGVTPHGVIEDRELHCDGVAALDGVDVLILSAHPEYWTAPMLDAVESHLARGASLLCLGGNAMYWVTSLHPTKPHLMEVRRWAGSQTTSVDAGDRYHQFEPRIGGIWADAGRGPERILGESFAGFGGDSVPYRRTEASHHDAWSWLFAGVAGETISASGLNTGAGNEYDCVLPAAGTAGETVVLASAYPDAPDAYAAFEHGDLRAPQASVRADIAITATRAGGYVLSLGSVTASGCLPLPGSDLAKICTNFLSHVTHE